MVKNKTFTGFNVSLKTGSKRKQRLSNHLRIEIDTNRTTVAQKLTLREARALQRWLNTNLDGLEASSSSSSASA